MRLITYFMTKYQLMFDLLVKYKNVVTDEEIELIKQNKAIDLMYVCQEILIILDIACHRLLAHNFKQLM